MSFFDHFFYKSSSGHVQKLVKFAKVLSGLCVAWPTKEEECLNVPLVYYDFFNFLHQLVFYIFFVCIR